MIVLDDLGFAQLGCFGSDIATPNIDALAHGGLRYNRFHVTALCSPTRACLLTGRNHHAVGVGFLPDMPIAHPGYSGTVPGTAAPLPRVLRDAGYNTFCVGKWHLTPGGERGSAGPFDRWPLGFGFERYYGFLHGDANHWAPNLVRDNHYVDPPSTPDDGYHLTEDLANQAVRYVTEQHQAAPDRPFFLYLALGAVHSPHHVASEWIDPYRGRFDEGWERWRETTHARQVELGVVPDNTELSERPPWIADWDALSAAERRTLSRQMEVFAGFLTHTDAQIGRVVDQLDRLGILDDTIVLLVSDNGASAEGGVVGTFNEHRFTEHVADTIEGNAEHDDDLGGSTTYPHYAWGWAWAGNTPLKLWKRYTWLGGCRTPLIVHHPNGFPARGEVRDQFVHAIDLAPTVLELAGITAPETVDGVTQQRVDGASIAATFADSEVPSPRNAQYFEMLGSRSIYADGWKATTNHVSRGVIDEERLLEGSRDFDQDRWALFDLDHDFAEAHDLADEHPERLQALAARWNDEAERNQVFPLIDDLIARIDAMLPPPNPLGQRIVYRPEGAPVPDDSVPRMFAGVAMTARVSISSTGADGVLCAMGDWTGGFALYVADDRLVYAVNRAGDAHTVTSEELVPRGDHELGFEYVPDSDRGPILTLRCDGGEIGGGPLPFRLPMVWQHGGTALRIGEDRGLPVSDAYAVPFAWTGVLHDLIVTTPALFPRPGDAARAALHQD
jgi:arylsulfatase A-like enzyme